MLEDLNILFSTLNNSYQEAIQGFRVLEDDSVTSKIMSDGKVLKPIRVFQEGEFATVTRTGKPIKLVVDKQRMEKWIHNTQRDVPFNYDHKREHGPNELGWLRTRSSSVYLEQDENGKWGLYAQPELTEKLFNQVKEGRYRDVSLEIDTADEVIVGIAVTNYPRLKTLTQMSEIVDEDTRTALKNQALSSTFENYDAINVWYTNSSEQDRELFSSNINKIINPPQEKQVMDEAQVKALMDSMRADLENSYKAELTALRDSATKTQDELEKLRREKEEAERVAKRARTVLGFSTMVDGLIAGENGDSYIPAGSREDVIELFCYLADHDEAVLFSELEDDKHVNPSALLERVLKAQGAQRAIFKASVVDNGTTPVVDNAEDGDAVMASQLRTLFRQKTGFNKEKK